MISKGCSRSSAEPSTAPLCRCARPANGITACLLATVNDSVGGCVTDPTGRSRQRSKVGEPGVAAAGHEAATRTSGSGHSRLVGPYGHRYGWRSNRPAASPWLRLWTRHASVRIDRSTGDAPGAEGGRGRTSSSTDTGQDRPVQGLARAIRPAAAGRVFHIAWHRTHGRPVRDVRSARVC